MIDSNIHQTSTFSSVANFLKAKKIPAGISTIYSGGLPIDLLVSPGKSDTTIFFFHGAIERHFKLPVLSGLGISGGLDANRIFISDPSLVLDDELFLSWYAGSYCQPGLQQILASVFKKILESLGSDRAVFFGGSGGGFAALLFATQFQDSLALVFNPQTNIAKYSERAVRDFAEKAFQTPAGQENPLDSIPSQVVLDLRTIYSAPVETRVAYMQNSNDEPHLKHHLFPFSQAIHRENSLYLLKEPWKDGHSPPPKELLAMLLNLAVESSNWNQSLINVGFKNIHEEYQ